MDSFRLIVELLGFLWSSIARVFIQRVREGPPVNSTVEGGIDKIKDLIIGWRAPVILFRRNVLEVFDGYNEFLSEIFRNEGIRLIDSSKTGLLSRTFSEFDRTAL